MIKKIVFGTPIYVGKTQLPSISGAEVGKYKITRMGDEFWIEDPKTPGVIDKTTTANVKYWQEEKKLVEATQDDDEVKLQAKYKDDQVAINSHLQKQDAFKKSKKKVAND